MGDNNQDHEDRTEADNSFPVGRRAILVGATAGVLGTAAVGKVGADNGTSSVSDRENGPPFADEDHTHDGDRLGVDEPVDTIDVIELSAAAIDHSDLTGGDRLSSLVDGNLSIDSGGALNASDRGGGVWVDGRDGANAVQAAIDDAEVDGHDTVNVYGRGEVEWTTSLEVPNDMTLDVANTLSITVPSDHNLTAYDMDGADILSLITNKDRSSAKQVTIRGGAYDLSNVPERTNYAAIWLHECSNGLIDDVVCRGAGTPVYDDRGGYRSFNLILTVCEESEIRDSEGHNAGYDNIGIRGGNDHCRVVRSGGTGGSSGTIQSARWGGWGLNDRPTNITYEDCWGRRIYDHGGKNITFDGCRNAYRIQTLGSDNVTVRNTQGYRGRVLLYTYQSDMNDLTVENMSFSADSDQDDAITVGLYDADLTNVAINNVEARRDVFLQFDSYGQSGNSIDWAEITNCRQYATSGDSPSSFITQVDDRLVPDVLRVSDSVCHDADSGVDGAYGAVRVRNCAFRNVNKGPIDVDSDDVETAMIDEW